MKRNLNYSILIVLLFLGFLTSCRSIPKSIPEDLPTAKYFQKGQEAAIQGYYEEALFYYHTFLERHPDQLQKVVEAEYEIAFIHYKSKNFDTAQKLFEAILEKYAQSESDILPAWPEILSTKLLLILEEKKA